MEVLNCLIAGQAELPGGRPLPPLLALGNLMMHAGWRKQGLVGWNWS